MDSIGSRGEIWSALDVPHQCTSDAAARKPLPLNVRKNVVCFLLAHLHGAVDRLIGALLTVSPWLFGFAALAWRPRALVRRFEVLAGLVTQAVPGTSVERQTHGTAA